MINTVERFNADLINKLASQANELDSVKTTVADYEKKFDIIVHLTYSRISYSKMCGVC